MLVSLVCCIGIALSGCSTEPRVAPAPPFDTWATLPPTGSVGEPEAVGPWRVTVTEIDTADISTNRQVTPDKDATVSVHFAVRPKDPQQAAHWQDGLSWRFAGANNISYRGLSRPTRTRRQGRRPRSSSSSPGCGGRHLRSRGDRRIYWPGRRLPDPLTIRPSCWWDSLTSPTQIIECRGGSPDSPSVCQAALPTTWEPVKRMVDPSPG